MIKINLVPQELLDREKQQRQNFQVLLVAGVVVFVLVSVTVKHYNDFQKAEKELHAAQKDYNDNWADIGSKIAARQEAKKAIETRLGVIMDLLKSRYLYPHFMVDMSVAMPSSVWITNMTAAKDSNGIKVTAQATASSAPGVTKWIRSLAKPAPFGSFDEPTISAITATDDPATNGKLYGFSLSTTYRPK